MQIRRRPTCSIYSFYFLRFSLPQQKVCHAGFHLYLWSFPLDPALHLQLSQREVVVHEQSVPSHHAQVPALRRHVAGQEVRQPAAGLGAEQLVRADRLRIILQRREGAVGGHTQRLYHV